MDNVALTMMKLDSPWTTGLAEVLMVIPVGLGILRSVMTFHREFVLHFRAKAA